MINPSHDAANELRRVIDLAGPYLALGLRRRQDQNPLHELFHRLKSCRLSVLRIDQLVRGEARMRASELMASQIAKAAGAHKRFRFHIKRMNRRRKRMLQEAFIHIEAFYWNASRAADSAVALGLLKSTREPYDVFDAVKIRHLLIEHEKLWSRPIITLDADPVFKPAARLLPGMAAQGGVFTHARQLALGLQQRINAAIVAP